MQSQRARPEPRPEPQRSHRSQTTVFGFVSASAIGLGAALLGSCVVDIGEPIVEIDDDATVTDTDDFPTDPNPSDDPITDPDDTDPGPTDTDPPVGPTTTTDDTPSDTDPTTDDDADASPSTDDGPTLPDSDAGCASGSESCDGMCVPEGTCVPPPPPCEETCDLPNAEVACVDEVCTLVECDDGWVDCDGLEENGCEIEFDSGLPAESPFSVTHQTIDSDDDWLGIPVYPFEVVCSPTECGPSHHGVPNQVPLFIGTTPDPGDLRAGFSMAWDSTGLWIRAVILDDEWVEGVLPSDGSGFEPEPRVYDHLQFVFDGFNQGNYGDPADHHLIMGIDDRIFDQRDSGSLRQKVSVDTQTVGKCRVMLAKLSEAYLSADNQTPIAGTDKVFGFSIEVDDFDRNDDDPTEVERQHQLFFQNPGAKYVSGPRDLPDLTLAP